MLIPEDVVSILHEDNPVTQHIVFVHPDIEGTDAGIDMLARLDRLGDIAPWQFQNP